MIVAKEEAGLVCHPERLAVSDPSLGVNGKPGQYIARVDRVSKSLKAEQE